MINDLLVLGAAGEQLIRQYRRSKDLSRLDVQILLCLAEAATNEPQSGLCPSSIARRLATTEPHVVNRLELARTKGLVRKAEVITDQEGAVSSDARRRFYILTAQGRVMAKTLEGGLGAINDVLIALSSKKAQEGVRSLAQALVRANRKGLLEEPSELAEAIIERALPAGRHDYRPLSHVRIQRVLELQPRQPRKRKS